MTVIRETPTVETWRDLFTCLEQHAIELVLDIGANHGQFGQLLRDGGYRGNIHSFEPVSASYQRLRQTAGDDPQWHTWQTALGAQPGQQTIHIANNDGYSSFLPPSPSGERLLGNTLSPIQDETVPMTTLDAFLQTLPAEAVQKPIFLKLDTQGFDLQVIAGARQNLPRIRAVLSEIAWTPLYDSAPDYRHALKTWENKGFHLAYLLPTHRRQDLTLIEAACCLINRRPQPVHLTDTPPTEKTHSPE